MKIQLKESFLRNALNIKGYKTRRKIVVIESDDWGSIRMPSKAAYARLLANGIRVDQSSYDRLDILENQSDFSALLDLLAGFKTAHQQSPIFTLNTIMTNPDFEKIRKGNFMMYHEESFFDSYQHYYGENLQMLWQTGIQERCIKPQYHARAHINTDLWMRDLRAGNRETLLAFDQGFFGLKTKTSASAQNHYLAAYWAENEKDLNSKLNWTNDGLKLFKAVFGYNAQSMIACNYIWPQELELPLQAAGIRYLQGQRAQMAPDLKTGVCSPVYHFSGQRNLNGQIYLVRNCLFEPYSDLSKDWVNSCIREISNAFYWKTPAIISSHRINYVGGMEMAHRDKNLEQLRQLIMQILKKWPETEFMSSDALGQLIENK